MGSKQKTWSSVFSVTHRSRKPSASARVATRRTSPMSIGSGERCGSDMPNAILSLSAICSSFEAVSFAPTLTLPRLRGRGLQYRAAEHPAPQVGGPGWGSATEASDLLDQLHLGAVGGFDE